MGEGLLLSKNFVGAAHVHYRCASFDEGWCGYARLGKLLMVSGQCLLQIGFVAQRSAVAEILPFAVGNGVHIGFGQFPVVHQVVRIGGSSAERE